MVHRREVDGELGPGLVVAVVGLAAWLPAILVVAARSTYGLGWRQAVTVAAVPYALWLLFPARHLLGQIQHLL